MRIWIDMTAAAHPVLFRPIVARLRDAGHDVEVTARDYGQTLGLLERAGIEHTVLGPGHAGGSRGAKALALASRTRNAIAFARGRRFDVAAAHGSNDLALAARALRIPAVNATDYEWATTQHHIGCRLARRVLTPDAIPPERLERYGVTPRELRQYPGLKEEYYLADFTPDPAALDALGVDRSRIVVIVRPPPTVSLYHHPNELFPRLLDRLGRDESVHAVVIPRVAEQREDILRRGLPSLIVPGHAVDAQSLIALADLVVSAGGTMNREAVALGTPVHTLFSGRLGGVDERLVAQGRLLPLTDPDAVPLTRRPATAAKRITRDPGLWADLIAGVQPGPR